MELDNLLLLKIPFISKKTKNKLQNLGLFGSKYSFEGTAYYLIDPNNKYKVIWQRAKFNSFEYRPMDDSILHSKYKIDKKGIDEPTDGYLSLQKKGFEREKIFPYSKNEVERANENQISFINNFIFKNIKTVLNSEGIITGSNPSGSDAPGKFMKSPILIDLREKEINHFEIFVNSIKRIYKFDKKINGTLLENFNSIEEIENFYNHSQISLKELMNKNNIFKMWMLLTNNLEDERDVIWEGRLTKYISNFNNEEKISQKYLKKEIEKINSNYKNGFIEEDKAVIKLRSLFRKSLIDEVKDKKYSECVGGDISIQIEDSQASHIISVQEIREKKLDYNLISDKNNGLLLSPTIHTIFDKKKISFDTKGKVIIFDEEYNNGKFDIKNIFLKENFINDERLKNLEKRNKNLIS